MLVHKPWGEFPVQLLSLPQDLGTQELVALG